MEDKRLSITVVTSSEISKASVCESQGVQELQKSKAKPKTVKASCKSHNSLGKEIKINIPSKSDCKGYDDEKKLGQWNVRWHKTKSGRNQQQYTFKFSHDGDNKTEVHLSVESSSDHSSFTTKLKKSILTGIQILEITGPHLIVSGSLSARAANVALTSSHGSLKINSRLICVGVCLVAERHIRLTTSATIWSSRINTKSVSDGHTLIEGRIFSLNQNVPLRLYIESNLVTSVDSCVGSCKNFNTVTSELNMTVIGDMANFGKIRSKRILSLRVTGSFQSFEESPVFDTAQNCFTSVLSLIEEKLVAEEQNKAYHLYDPKDVARQLQAGFDPNVPIEIKGTKSKRKTPKKYLKEKSKGAIDHDSGHISFCESLLETWGWKSGEIHSEYIEAKVGDFENGTTGDVLDCCQFQASRKLSLAVAGNAEIRSNSIWCPGPILAMTVKGSFTINLHSQLKTDFIDILQAETICNEGIVATLLGARVHCHKNFDNKHLWFSQDGSSRTEVVCSRVKQGQKSWIEANGFLGFAISENVDCEWNGNIKADKLTIKASKSVTINAKCLVKDEMIFVVEDPVCQGCSQDSKIELSSLMKVDKYIEVYSSATKEIPSCKHTNKTGQKRLPSNKHPSLIISEKLICNGIKANDVAIQIAPRAEIALFPAPHGIPNADTDPCIRTSFIIAGAIDTCNDSLLQFHNSTEANIVCSNEFDHKGTISLDSDVAVFEVHIMDNAGEICGINHGIILIHKALKNLTNLSARSSLLIRGEKFHNVGNVDSPFLSFDVNKFQQEKSGACNAENAMSLEIHGSNEDPHWFGHMKARKLSIESKKVVICNASCFASRKMSFVHPVVNESKFIAAGDFSVQCGQATIKRPKTGANLTDEGDDYVDFILTGNMSCSQLVGHNSYMKISENADLRINNRHEDGNDKIVLRKLETSESTHVTISSRPYVCHASLIFQEFYHAADGVLEIETTSLTLKTKKLVNNGFILGTNDCKGIGIICDDIINSGDIESIYFIDCQTALTSGSMSIETGTHQQQAWIKFREKFEISGTVSCDRLIFGTAHKEDMQNAAGGDILVTETGCLKTSQSLQLATNEGTVKIEGSVEGEAAANLSIDSNGLILDGRVETFQTLKLTNDTLHHNGLINSITECSLSTEWMTLQGTFQNIQSLELESWGLITMAAAKKNINKLNVRAHLVAVNSGCLAATETTIAAPFFMNSYGKELTNVNNVQNVKVGGNEQERISIETIVCLITGSCLEAKSIGNKSVLLFKFLSVTQSGIPDSDMIKAWSDALPVLESIKTDSSMENVQNAISRCSSLTASQLDLREACALHAAVNKFVDDLHNNGIKTFHVATLVDELVKANRIFHGLNLVRERLLIIPEIARKVRKMIKKGKCLSEYFGFRKMDGVEGADGIAEYGQWSYQAGVLQTSSDYRAKFDHSWRNQGLISTSAGDIIISSSVISSEGKGDRRLMEAANNIIMEAETRILLQNAKAKNVALVAGTADVKTIHTDVLDVQAKDGAKVTEAAVTNINIETRKGTAQLSDSSIKQMALVKGGSKTEITSVNAHSIRAEADDVEVTDAKSSYIEVEAGSTANVTNAQVTEINMNAVKGHASLTNSNVEKVAHVKGGLKATVKGVNARDIAAEADNVEASNIKSKNIDLTAVKGHASLTNSNVEKIAHVKGGLKATVKGVNARDIAAEANNVEASNITSKNIYVNAVKGHASITDSSIENLAEITAGTDAHMENIKAQAVTAKAKTVCARNIDACNLNIEAQSSAKLTESTVTNLHLKSAQGRAILKDSAISGVATVTAMTHAEAANVQVGSMLLEAEHGTVETSGKVEAEILELKGDKIKLDRNGTVDHKLGTLKIDTKRIEDIGDIIHGKGMYHAMHLRDKLDLAVSDQSILLSSDVIGTAALSLKAKDISVGSVNINKEKGIHLEATSGDLRLDHSKLASKGNVILKSNEGSIGIHASSVSAQKSVQMKAKNDIDVTAEVIHRKKVTKKGNWFKRKKIVETWSEVKGSSIQAGEDVIVESEEGKVQFVASGVSSKKDTTVKAKKGIEFKSLVTTRTRKVGKSTCFGMFGSSNQSSNQTNHGGFINVRRLKVVSEKENIDVIGTSINTEGNAIFAAERGSITFRDRILKRYEKRSSTGFSFTADRIGFESSSYSSSANETAASNLTAANLTVKAKNNFTVSNAYNLNIAENADIEAAHVEINWTVLVTINLHSMG